MKVPVIGPPASSLWDSGKGEAPLWDSSPSSAKEGCGWAISAVPPALTTHDQRCFLTILPDPENPALSLNRCVGGGLRLRTSALGPTHQRARLTARPTSAGQRRACRGQVSHLSMLDNRLGAKGSEDITEARGNSFPSLIQ